MNEMNELEMQLHSWAPRPPSEKVKNAIFRRATAAGAEELAPVRFAWLGPATAALLLMGVVFNQRTNPSLSGPPSSTAMVAMIMSNQSASAYLPGTFQQEQNNFSAETFEWTNGGGFTSSIGSLSPKRGGKPK
jgi:hypothetical protein